MKNTHNRSQNSTQNYVSYVAENILNRQLSYLDGISLIESSSQLVRLSDKLHCDYSTETEPICDFLNSAYRLASDLPASARSIIAEGRQAVRLPATHEARAPGPRVPLVPDVRLRQDDDGAVRRPGAAAHRRGQRDMPHGGRARPTLHTHRWHQRAFI